MTQSYYSIITNNGLLKEAAASSGSPLNLTHLAVGDANGTSYNPTGLQTALVNEVYRTTLTHVAVDETNPNQLIVEGVISETVGSFYIREVGIFDSEGQLFAIGKYPETFKSTTSTGSGKRLYVRMILGFTNSPQVSLIQSEDLNNDPNFNANVLAAIDDINSGLTALNSALTQKLTKAANLSDVADVVQARNNLGLQIGVNVQAFATNLSALSGLAGSANKIPIFTGLGQMGLTDLFSNRNVIINGDFNIWQYGTSFLSIASGYSADRWRFGKAGTTGVVDISRSTDVPTFAQSGRIFNYSLLVDCQTADNSIGAGDVAFIEQRIEGYNFLNLSQKQITLSFWVKSTKIGTSCVFITNSGNDRTCVKEFTINATDTWEFKVVTFPASSSDGTWNYTNGIGARVGFTLICGSTYQTVAGSYANGEFYGSANQVNHYDSILNNFKVCGIQLEAGSVVTPFESRSYLLEDMLCKRYYDQLISPNLFGGKASSTTNIQFASARFTVPMRTAPSVVLYNFGVANQVRSSGGVGVNLNSPSVGTSIYGVEYVNVSSGLSSGEWYQCGYAANAEL